MSLEQKAETLMKQYKMTENCDNILVAFSGGSDSSALLFFLIKYIENLNKNNEVKINSNEDNKDNKDTKIKIFAAHMNHMIREQDAYRDEDFAVETCKKYGVKIFTERQNIPEIAKETKKTVEEAARDARYDFLRRIAAELNKTSETSENRNSSESGGKTKIATAHTASDNTETVIFNMARGCGLDGLCGISPVNSTNSNKNCNIIRPFLSCGKEDIIKYCGENNISYVEDTTNEDDNYTRNFIRRNIASKLKVKFAGADNNIFKMTEIIRDAADFIDLCAEDIIKENRDGIDINFLMSKHKSLRRAVISKFYENALSSDFNIKDIKKLEYKHILYVEELLENSKNLNKSNKSIDLPGFVTARVSNNKFNAEKIKDKKTSGNRR